MALALSRITVALCRWRNACSGVGFVLRAATSAGGDVQRRLAKKFLGVSRRVRTNRRSGGICHRRRQKKPLHPAGVCTRIRRTNSAANILFRLGRSGGNPADKNRRHICPAERIITPAKPGDCKSLFGRRFFQIIDRLAKRTDTHLHGIIPWIKILFNLLVGMDIVSKLHQFLAVRFNVFFQQSCFV